MAINVAYSYCRESQYVFSILLEEILGIPVSFDTCGIAHNYELILPNNKKIIIKNCCALENGPSKKQMPEKVSFVSNQFIVEKDVPLLYGENMFQVSSEEIVCGIDIVATCFFMLTRFEEIAVSERDVHGRFPATASLAFKNDFLERPIVDEYAEMLWAMLVYLDPSLQRKRVAGKIYISCDVDEPFDASVRNLEALSRSFVGDVIKRRRLLSAAYRVNRYVWNKFGVYRFDPKHTFGWYMSMCEKYNHQVAFYFIADSSEPNNGYYSIFEQRIKRLMLDIESRNHVIGMHGSYQSFNSKCKVYAEKKLLEQAFNQYGINKPVQGNRQHYLRWDISITPEYLNAAGYAYDTSGGYADRPGFRFGTAHEFSMWGWQSRKKLRLKQRPLIVMENSIFASSYLNLGYTDKALVKMQLLRTRALKFGGNFSLLWHNSHFLHEKDKVFFEEMLKQ